LILLWLFAEGVLSFQRSRKTRWRAVQIRGRRLTLADASILLATTPDDLRWRLERAGRTIDMGEDGQEWLTLDDVRAIMK
jgi:hypothetical protein